MPNTTSILEIVGKVTGLVEGGSATFRKKMTNSTGVREAREITVGAGIANATTISNPINARAMVLVVGSDTNASPWRISGSTSEVGVPLSSRGFAVFTIPPSTVASTYYVYSGTTREITGVRVLFY